MKKVIILQAVAALALASCAQNEETRILPEGEGMFKESVKELSATIPDFEMDDDTRTTIDAGGHFSWEMSDELGLWPVTSTGGQAMFYVSSVTGNSKASFTANGFGVLRGETYSALYPFDDSFTRTGAVLKYDDQVQTGNNNTTHLGSHDYLAATMTLDAGSTTTGSMNFSHLGCITKFTLNVPADSCANKVFTKLTLDCASSPFVTEANYDPINGTYKSTTKASSIEIPLSGDDFKRNGDKNVVVYAMMSPSNWLGANNITATLTDVNGDIYSGTFSGKDMSASQGKGIGYKATLAGAEKIIDLTKGGETANCYIVSKAGQYKFKATQGNTATTVNSTYCGVLWETINTTTAPQIGTLISDVKYESDGYIYFTANDVKGNAIIAAYNNPTKLANDVKWSWHIWLTDQPQDDNYGTFKLMDRNLGAINNTPGNGGAIGFVYQWGRKDPLPGACSYNYLGQSDRDNKYGGKVQREVQNDALTTTGILNSQAVSNTSAYASQHPTEFFVQDGNGNTNSYHWCKDSNCGSLWGSNKTKDDPCPAGYRVPDSGLGLDIDSSVSGDGLRYGIKLKTTGSNAFYWPVTGWRGEHFEQYSDNTLTGYSRYYLAYKGRAANYWTCTAQNNHPSANGLWVGNTYNFDFGVDAFQASYHAWIAYCCCACPVRCQKIQ